MKKSQGEKIVNKIKKDFINACVENLKLVPEIKVIIAKFEEAKVSENFLFVEVHKIELETALKQYKENCKVVGLSIAQLSYDEVDYTLN